MKTKYFVLVIIVSLILLSIHSCSKSSTNPMTGGVNGATINISGMAFPASSTVAKGTTVTWNNKDGFAHTVTSDDGASFNSGNLPGGATFSFQANTAGSFPYHCNIHSNMHGTLIVTP